MNFLSYRRIKGVFKRHFYLWLQPEYFFDSFWQPVVEVFIWGFVSFYIGQLQNELKHMVSFFLGAVVLWAVLRRAQHEITFTFMEEAWSRNLQNILISPVNMVEYFSAAILFSIVKLVFEITFMGTIIAAIFGFNILKMGMGLFPFAISLLITGWAIGLVVNAAIIYFGRGLVALSWIMAFVLQPFSCVFYPLSALPTWAQGLAKSFPATWIFEGMRSVLLGQGFHIKPWLLSMGLNGLYLGVAYAVFSWVMKLALDRGLLTRLEW